VYYLGVGICLIISGCSLLVGDDGMLLGASFSFGKYKDVAGSIFVLAGIALVWRGMRKTEK
jgi:hypothetical protein